MSHRTGSAPASRTSESWSRCRIKARTRCPESASSRSRCSAIFPCPPTMTTSTPGKLPDAAQRPLRGPFTVRVRRAFTGAAPAAVTFTVTFIRTLCSRFSSFLPLRVSFSTTLVRLPALRCFDVFATASVTFRAARTRFGITDFGTVTVPTPFRTHGFLQTTVMPVLMLPSFPAVTVDEPLVDVEAASGSNDAVAVRSEATFESVQVCDVVVQAPLQLLNLKPLAGVARSVTVLPPSTTHDPPSQTEFCAWLVAITDPLPAGLAAPLTVKRRTNTAVAARSADVSDTMHAFPVQAPSQWSKRYPEAGVGVSTTTPPESTVQLAPLQLAFGELLEAVIEPPCTGEAVALTVTRFTKFALAACSLVTFCPAHGFCCPEHAPLQPVRR